MSKSRLSNTERQARGSQLETEMHRFLGLSLAGGKTDKACLAVLEYFPKYKKVFLTKIFEKIKSDENISADLKLFEHIEQSRSHLEYLALDVPWQLPLCLSCQLKCPGYESCTLPHIDWMWKNFREKSKKKKPKKIFTPYTQRSAEIYLATELEEPFIVPHALGANQAPLLARAFFLQRRLNLPTIEVFPKLTLWRVGRSLNIAKSHLRSHRHAVGGGEARRAILQALSQSHLAFVYEQDVRMMVENAHAFDAFLCALTAYLKFQNLTETRPQGFPAQETWIEFPIKSISWKGT